MCFGKSVSDTEKCSFVNTRWALHTPPSKNHPLKEDRLSFSGRKLDWRILLGNFSLSSFNKPSSQGKCIMSVSETAEVCLLIHPPTNNCLFSSSPPHKFVSGRTFKITLSLCAAASTETFAKSQGYLKVLALTSN